MVEYIDNSVIAQMSVPDMRFCIQYALSYPERIGAVINPLDLSATRVLSFGKPDVDTFSLLKSAFYAAKKGGALPAVLNAANEVAVAEFLREKIKFNDITDTVNEVVSRMDSTDKIHNFDEIILADREARALAEEIISAK